jgi:predicted glutamine amidotransferase
MIPTRRPHVLPEISEMQQTNCHPFRHERWLFMHHGYINDFATIKRDLTLAVDPSR